MVRSQVAHGVIKGIDTDEAKAMPGVLGVWTGADLNAAGYGPLKTLIPVPNRDGSPMKTPTRHSLATDKVRFVGDPVAFVVAETLAAGARTRPRRSMLDIEPLPAVTDAREAAKPGAPIVFDDVPGNICVDYHYGDTRQGGRGLRQGRARHAPAPGQQPHRRLRDGAALGDRPSTTRRPTATRCRPATRARSASSTRWPTLLEDQAGRRCAS